MQTEPDTGKHWKSDEEGLKPTHEARLSDVEVRLALLEDVVQGLRHILLGLLHRRRGAGEEVQP